MDASPLDIVLWNWEPLAVTLAVGVAGVFVTARRASSRPAVRTVLLAFAWSLAAFVTGSVLLITNSLDAHYDVANVDASPLLVLDVWRAEQVVSVGLLVAATVPALVLAVLGVTVARRAV